MRLYAAALSVLIFIQARAPVPTGSSLDGKWQWTGPAGWQRITLDIKTTGGKLTGSLTMGPGKSPTDRSGADWEHFFEPSVFTIADGVVQGQSISFTQVLSKIRADAPVMGVAGMVSPTVSIAPNKAERWLYNGILEGDRLTLTREIPVRRDDAFAIGEHKTVFAMTRTGSADSVKSPESSRTPAVLPSSAPTFIDIAVADANGKPVPDLTAQDFAVSENGSAVPISRLGVPASPVNVLLAFDHNLTWLQDNQNFGRYADDSWRELLVSVSGFLTRLRPDDRFAVGAFEDKPGMIVNWRKRSDVSTRLALGSVVSPPDGQKNLYGAVDWIGAQFAGATGRKIAVIFTDGRDGRLSPKWPRDSQGREVLDPLFGLEDKGEEAEFEKTLSNAAQTGIRFYFIAVNPDHDPEFGPAYVGRRISGLYPGAGDGIAGYHSRIRLRMERLADISGGRVMYGNTPQDAIALYSDLYDELAIGRSYTLEFASDRIGLSNIEVQVRRLGLHVTRLQGASRAR